MATARPVFPAFAAADSSELVPPLDSPGVCAGEAEPPLRTAANDDAGPAAMQARINGGNAQQRAFLRTGVSSL